MPTITQILGDFPLPGRAPTPLEQIAMVETLPGASMRHESGTSFLWGLTYAGDPGEYAINERSVVFKGTGFFYDGQPLPASGTITSIIVCDGGMVTGNTTISPESRMEYTGLSINVSEMRDVMRLALDGNTASLDTYFRGLAWAYEGSDNILPSDWYEGGNLADKINGNDGFDYLRGLGGKDTIHGNDHIDTLFGDEGNDALFGDSGDDQLSGSAGADSLDGGAGNDTASYFEAPSGVTVSLVNPSINTGEAKGDTFVSIASLSGSSFDDVLVGDSVSNSLFGFDGNDTLIGGAGVDGFVGGQGFDRVDYSGGSAVVAALNNYKLNKGQATGEVYSSIENLTGSGSHDSLYGTGQANSVEGGAGNDQIKGYAGNDTLTGGSGRDTFIFNSALSASTNVDTLMDFNDALDTIHLDNAIFTALTKTGALPVSAFEDVADGGKGPDDRIIYNSDSGNLYYDRDGTGTAYEAIKFAVLTGSPTMTAADFVVI